MNDTELKDRIIKTIDQFYNFPSKKYIEDAQLHYIGGILQTALHLVPNDVYYDIKEYIYQTYGYDPGGCDYDQIVKVGEEI